MPKPQRDRARRTKERKVVIFISGGLQAWDFFLYFHLFPVSFHFDVRFASFIDVFSAKILLIFRSFSREYCL